MRNARELYHHLRDTYGEEFVQSPLDFEAALSLRQPELGLVGWPVYPTQGLYLSFCEIPDGTWEAWCAHVAHQRVSAGQRLLENYAQERSV